ncbi:MAG: acetate--CoA ligase family protein [Bacillota bacterium]|jgi:acyl-CoA synthetase (NDP forming)
MMSFQALFNPRGVAVAGSVTPGKLGNVLINRLVEGGFEKIYALNPKAKGVGQVPGFASAQDITEPLDLVVIASPAVTVKDVLEDCGKKGVKAAIIITSGFSEAGNAVGEEEIKRVAEKYGIRFTGPNCAGLVNTHSQLLATLEAAPPKGNTALISQSGAVGGTIMAWAEEQGLGISKFISYGNGNDLNELEFLRYLKDDPETKVIAMYLENIKNGRKFMQVLKEVTRVKPVVVIKSGRTSTGQRATLSHTGSMAGADKVYDAALRECGALRVETIEDMFDLCKGFSCLPPVTGCRLAIVTNSGGPGVMAADKAEEVGLDVAEPSPELIAAFKGILPPHAGIKNPIDITVEGTGEEYREVLKEALTEYDAALALYIGTPYLEAMPIANGIIEAAKVTKKPIVSTIQVGSDVKESIEVLKEHNLPNFVSGERAVKVLARMTEYYKYLKASSNLSEYFPQEVGYLSGDGSLLEPDGMALLRKNGISVPEFRFAATRQEAVTACNSLGYPVVMKVVSPEILHKSDCGGVVLNIDGDEEAEKAFDQIKHAADGRDFRGVVIYPMLKGGREVILGLTRDVQFGPVIAFGLGGIYTEVLKDIVLRVAPVDRKGAEEMIRSIRTYPILKGIRGQEPADLDALAEAIVNFSKLPFLYPNIEEADLNPVFVFPKGVLVGDVRLVLRKE